MAVISDCLRAAYFDITKVASSSVKEAIWELEHNRVFAGVGIERVANHIRWRLAKSGIVRPRNIHEVEGYRCTAFDLAKVPQGYLKFTLVRDPANRIFSAWKDKIHLKQFRWRGEVMDIENEGLDLDPTFGQFIDDFDRYRMVSRPARVHTTPYSWHLGNDRRYFDHIFRVEAFEDLQQFMTERSGRDVQLQHANRSKLEKRDARLTSRQIDRLLSITEPDYNLLDGIYDIDAARKRFTAISKE